VKFAGAPISWKSQKQMTVALSTTEAECMTLTECVKFVDAAAVQEFVCAVVVTSDYS
jgi:hypothetical protein